MNHLTLFLYFILIFFYFLLFIVAFTYSTNNFNNIFKLYENIINNLVFPRNSDKQYAFYLSLILNFIDVLVDGKFEEDKKDITLKFRGSSNQRIIDVKQSLLQHKIVEYEI